jgi:hypothetical protein
MELVSNPPWNSHLFVGVSTVLSIAIIRKPGILIYFETYNFRTDLLPDT